MSNEVKAALATFLTVSGAGLAVTILVLLGDYAIYVLMLLPIGIVLAGIYNLFLGSYRRSENSRSNMDSF